MTQNDSKPLTPVDISGRMLARNTLLNLIGRILPLLVAVAAIPFVIHHLGPDRYGLLAIAYIVVGYFALFSLGIGPATTKFVAELLGKNEVEKLPELVWTALISQTGFGLVAGAALALASPLLADRVLKIPVALHPQARLILLILATALPIDFANGSLRGVLGASQRFDLLNAVSIPSSSLTYVLPVLGLMLGFGLPAIVLFLVLARVAALIVLAYLCLRLYPALRQFRFNSRLIRSLLGFGGWVTVTNAISPILRYTDRFFLGAIVSVAAIGYYSIAVKAIAAVMFIPGSLSGTLLPAFSSLQGAGDSSRTGSLFLKSYKYVFLVTTPTLLTLIVFAKNIFTLWLGPTVAAEITLPFQIFAAGRLISILGPICGSLLSGRGRPDIVSKIYMFHLPVNTAVVWFMVSRWGITGAALSEAFRSVLDTALLFYFSARISGLNFRRLVNKESLPVLGAAVCSLLLVAVGWVAASQPIAMKSSIFSVTMVTYTFVTLRLALNVTERRLLWGALGGAWLRLQQG